MVPCVRLQSPHVGERDQLLASIDLEAQRSLGPETARDPIALASVGIQPHTVGRAVERRTFFVRAGDRRRCVQRRQPVLEREQDVGEDDGRVLTSTFPGDPAWQMLLALQPTSLATKKARALLPSSYSKADAVFNVQRASLLVAAFAQNRLDLLRTAMQDRIHQPYRQDACPLLKQLLPLASEPELAGIALSGAGPSVLIFLAEDTTPLAAETRLRAILAPAVEILSLRIAPGATSTIL